MNWPGDEAHFRCANARQAATTRRSPGPGLTPALPGRGGCLRTHFAPGPAPQGSERGHPRAEGAESSGRTEGRTGFNGRAIVHPHGLHACGSVNSLGKL